MKSVIGTLLLLLLVLPFAVVATESPVISNRFLSTV